MKVQTEARLLIVDDEVTNVRLLETIVARAGYPLVRGISDPRDVMTVVEDFQPDIVLLDVTMPWLDGFQVLAQLRASPLTRDVPVVIVTGQRSAETHRRALAEGANDYVSKPFDPAEVVLRISNLLETRFLQLELHAHNRLLELTVEKRSLQLARYVQVLDAMLDPVVIFDAATLRIGYGNDAFAAVMGHVGSAIEGALAWELRPEWEAVGLRRRIEEFRASGASVDRFDSPLPDASGALRTNEMVLQRIRTNGEGDVLVAIARDVEARRAAEEALRGALDLEQQARTRLRLVDEMKDAFLSAISHELRTPLTVVLGAALTLRRLGPGLGEARSALLVERLADHAERLDRLLEDLLAIGGLNRIELQAHRTYVQVDEVVHAMIEAAQLGSRSVRLLAPPVRAYLDEDKLRRILAQLLDNVKRHTPERSAVTVTVVQRGDAAHLTIADDGPGIPHDLKTEVFAPFVSGGGALHLEPGIGIGLALVSTYVGIHGGTCWIEDAPGGGAAVHVVLPSGVAGTRGGVVILETDLDLMLHDQRSAS